MAPLNPLPISTPEFPKEILVVLSTLLRVQALSNIFNFPRESTARKYHSLASMDSYMDTTSKQLRTDFDIVHDICMPSSYLISNFTSVYSASKSWGLNHIKKVHSVRSMLSCQSLFRIGTWRLSIKFWLPIRLEKPSKWTSLVRRRSKSRRSW